MNFSPWLVGQALCSPVLLHRCQGRCHLAREPRATNGRKLADIPPIFVIRMACKCIQHCAVTSMFMEHDALPCPLRNMGPNHHSHRYATNRCDVASVPASHFTKFRIKAVLAADEALAQLKVSVWGFPVNFVRGKSWESKRPFSLAGGSGG